MSAPTRLRRALPVLWRAAAIFIVVFLLIALVTQDVWGDEIDGPTETTPTAAPESFEVAIYPYKKLDPAAPAGWSNSGKQAFCLAQPGSDWFAELPASCVQLVCENGYDAIQQDKVRYFGTFTWPASIEYPTDNIGWPPIYDAKHSELPPVDCTTPTPTPDPTPSISSTCINCEADSLPLMGDEGLKGLLIACLLALAGIALVTGQKLQQRRAEYRGRPRPVLSAQFGASVRPRVDAENFAPKRATDHISRDPWRHVRDKDN